MKCFLTLALTIFLAACAGYGGSGLKPGVATLDDVLHTMGEPARRWENPDHSLQLSYPRGPVGMHSYMVYLDPAGRLQKIENVMEMKAFARVQAGMSQDDVVRTLGPSNPAWTVYFPARRELVWEWRYCDDWNNAARFDVLFDKDSGVVRTTMSQREICGKSACYCGH